jgi:hypothetical protein
LNIVICEKSDLMTYIPNHENLTDDTEKKQVYSFCNAEGRPIYKTKEIHSDRRITFYPYNFNLSTQVVKPKQLKRIDFVGWSGLIDLPKIMKPAPYGLKFESSTQLLNILHKKFPLLEKLVISKDGSTRFSQKTITFNWKDLSMVIRRFKKEKNGYSSDRKYLINDLLSGLSDKVQKIPRTLKAGELEEYLSKFSSYDKITYKDIDAFSQIFAELPIAKISATTHLIKTKEKIDLIYIDDIISKFQQLLRHNRDDEEKWQQYFLEHTWTLNHLFPYEVILHKDKAYVGGKTLENEDGRIVDFLFSSGFKDNYALLEIKTPKALLLKNRAYRDPAVFSLSDELSGGVNQCLDQKDTLIKDFGRLSKTFDPKAVLVIGEKEPLTAHQKNCFELYRSNQKHIEIVTFDELEKKLLGLYKVLTGKERRK